MNSQRNQLETREKKGKKARENARKLKKMQRKKRNRDHNKLSRQRELLIPYYEIMKQILFPLD